MLENLPEKERPPVWMWHVPHLMEDHFEMLAEQRASDSNSDGDNGSPDGQMYDADAVPASLRKAMAVNRAASKAK